MNIVFSVFMTMRGATFQELLSTSYPISPFVNIVLITSAIPTPCPIGLPS